MHLGPPLVWLAIIAIIIIGFVVLRRRKPTTTPPAIAAQALTEPPRPPSYPSPSAPASSPTFIPPGAVDSRLNGGSSPRTAQWTIPQSVYRAPPRPYIERPVWSGGQDVVAMPYNGTTYYRDYNGTMYDRYGNVLNFAAGAATGAGLAALFNMAMRHHDVANADVADRWSRSNPHETTIINNYFGDRTAAQESARPSQPDLEPGGAVDPGVNIRDATRNDGLNVRDTTGEDSVVGGQSEPDNRRFSFGADDPTDLPPENDGLKIRDTTQGDRITERDETGGNSGVVERDTTQDGSGITERDTTGGWSQPTEREPERSTDLNVRDTTVDTDRQDYSGGGGSNDTYSGGDSGSYGGSDP